MLYGEQHETKLLLLLLLAAAQQPPFPSEEERSESLSQYRYATGTARVCLSACGGGLSCFQDRLIHNLQATSGCFNFLAAAESQHQDRAHTHTQKDTQTRTHTHTHTHAKR